MKLSKQGAIWLIIAIVLGVLRIHGIKHEAFQAAAHLYVGGLLGAYFSGKNKEFLWIAIGLSVLEVVCFFLVK